MSSHGSNRSLQDLQDTTNRINKKIGKTQKEPKYSDFWLPITTFNCFASTVGQQFYSGDSLGVCLPFTEDYSFYEQNKTFLFNQSFG